MDWEDQSYQEHGGYSLVWQAGDENDRMRLSWSPYSLYTPPTLWYHQEFNTSAEPARYFVFHSQVQGTRIQGTDNKAIKPLHPPNQIEYHQKDTESKERSSRNSRTPGSNSR